MEKCTITDLKSELNYIDFLSKLNSNDLDEVMRTFDKLKKEDNEV